MYIQIIYTKYQQGCHREAPFPRPLRRTPPGCLPTPPHERHPEAFALYSRHFVDPFATWAFNVKEGYDGVFRRRKGRRRDGTTYNLPFTGSLRDDVLAKHLDRQSWNDRQYAIGKTGKVIRKPLWVALLPGTTTDHVIIDLDNHNDVGWIYQRDNPLPVASVSLSYLLRLKKINDLGPQVIASSSRNLGTYAFFKMPKPVETLRAFEFFKKKLGEIGMGETKVYPVPPTRQGDPDPQCHRRLFGEGYLDFFRKAKKGRFGDGNRVIPPWAIWEETSSKLRDTGFLGDKIRIIEGWGGAARSRTCRT